LRRPSPAARSPPRTPRESMFTFARTQMRARVRVRTCTRVRKHTMHTLAGSGREIARLSRWVCGSDALHIRTESAKKEGRSGRSRQTPTGTAGRERKRERLFILCGGDRLLYDE
jgi:hypothetical protein